LALLIVNNRHGGPDKRCDQSRRDLDFSEEHSVGFVSELREVDRRCRRRDKPETVSGAPLGRCRDVNGRRRLEEVARELIDRVAESENAPGYATPFEIEGLDDRAHNVSQRVGGIQAIRDRKRVEYADISSVKLSGALIEISSGATVRDGSYPRSKSRGNSGVVRMQAQRACGREAVKSYERECAPVRFSIGGAEPPFHEAHVRMEIIGSTVAGVQVCSRPSQKQVGLRNDAAEVKDL